MASLTHVTLAALITVASAAVHAGPVEAEPRSATGTTQHPRVNTSASVMVSFKERVAEYAALQEKLSQSLPRLPAEATPQQIDAHQRALAELVRAARKNARLGELFTPDMQQEVRKLMAQVFKQRQDRRELRASIAEENPRGIRLTVNGRYPDAVPLATMPPEVLQNLPALPEDLEYRFVGDSLILFDSRAHIVVDFMPRALPSA